MADPVPKENTSWLVGLRQRTSSILTKLSHGSAPFITTFALIHLTAPVMANLGGSPLASQVMLLGREYYQTSFGEKFLVLLPLLVHPVTSTLKRVLSPVPARRLTHLLSLTGYAASAFVMIHFFTHRKAPSLPAPPIYELSPAELDFEYVKFALHEWPVRAWLGYVGLTAAVAWHAAEGMNVIWNTDLRNALGKSKVATKRARALIAGVVAVPVISGLMMLAREPLLAFTSQVLRFRAAFEQSAFYRY